MFSFTARQYIRYGNGMGPNPNGLPQQRPSFVVLAKGGEICHYHFYVDGSGTSSINTAASIFPERSSWDAIPGLFSLPETLQQPAMLVDRPLHMPRDQEIWCIATYLVDQTQFLVLFRLEKSQHRYGDDWVSVWVSEPMCRVRFSNIAWTADGGTIVLVSLLDMYVFGLLLTSIVLT